MNMRSCQRRSRGKTCRFAPHLAPQSTTRCSRWTSTCTGKTNTGNTEDNAPTNLPRPTPPYHLLDSLRPCQTLKTLPSTAPGTMLTMVKATTVMVNENLSTQCLFPSRSISQAALPRLALLPELLLAETNFKRLVILQTAMTNLKFCLLIPSVPSSATREVNTTS